MSMTPQAMQQQRDDYNRRRELREVESGHKEPTLKLETVKYIVAMLVAGIVGYYATLYGLREEVATLKVHVEYLRAEVDKQTRAIDGLTAAITAHTLAHNTKPPSRRP